MKKKLTQYSFIISTLLAITTSVEARYPTDAEKGAMYTLGLMSMYSSKCEDYSKYGKMYLAGDLQALRGVGISTTYLLNNKDYKTAKVLGDVLSCSKIKTKYLQGLGADIHKQYFDPSFKPPQEHLDTMSTVK
jgi:hypothetical protein